MCGLMISKPIGLLYISDVIIKDKIIRFYKNNYKSYFPYDVQNDTRSSKSNGKHNGFGYNFLIIYIYLNLVKKNQRIILQQKTL
jgi:hypothetical protein